MNIKYAILSVILCASIALGVYVYTQKTLPKSHFNTQMSAYKQSQLRVKSHVFDARIADTDNKRVKGLSGIKAMDADEALVFVFPTPQIAGFWMKDMLYSIDIVCARNNRVTDSVENFAPSTYPEVYTPKDEADMCVEFVAGTVKQLKIKTGDEMLLE